MSIERKLRVLYAEDSQFDADLARAYFEDHAQDLTLDVVDMGRTCLARIRQQAYDVLLLDNHLPDMDGTEVLKEMAASGIPLPVVVVTGVGDESLVVQVLRLGAWDYIPKHGNYVEALPAVLKKAVEEYGSLQEQRRICGQGQRRILYVERNAADIDLTMAHLKEVAAPVQLEVVGSSDQALELLLAGQQFDLVLIDLRMPDMSALDALREAKHRGLTVPFVVMTGKGDEAAAVAALKLGAYDYIVKRDNYLTQLPYAIENAVTRSQLIASNRRLQMELAERERAQESQRLLATIVESSDDAIISKSLDGIITSWNPGAEKLYGYAAAEVIGRHLSILVPADHADDLLQIMGRVKRGENIEHYETVRMAKGGKRIDVSLTISPIRAADGRISGAAQIARDVTEQRRLEAQFIEAQKLESIGRLAGGIAHDFNNLLTVINGYSEVALSKLEPSNQLYRPIAEVKRAGERAAWLTRQLLAFSRKQILQPKVLDLNVIVDELARMLRRLIGEHIELVTALNPALHGVLADAGQIEQVIMNLVVNARDAMPNGGKVTLETANIELDEHYTRQHSGTSTGSYVMLAVSDTGEGMDAATQTHIFEPFFTTKSKGEGTGLGLATVYGIVKQSGGHLWVYSELKKGSTFKVYLPRVLGPADAPAEQVSLQPRSGSETVLLVEDEEGVRKLILAILQGAGYSVLEAQNGRDALALFQNYAGSIQLIVTDIIMPYMSGPELVDRLSSLQAGLKFLFISGYTDDSILHHGLLNPGTPFLQKPFTSASLLYKMREILDA